MMKQAFSQSSPHFTRKGGFSTWQVVLAITLAAALCAIALSARAFIGRIPIGGTNLPCAVACGGDRGIVNTRFLGDAVDSFITGPSIDHFQSTLNASIDRGLGKFAELLEKQQDIFFKKLAEQRDQVMVELHATVETGLAQLDEIAKGWIKESEERLRILLGEFSYVLLQNSDAFSSAIVSAVITCVIIGALAYMGVLLYQLWFLRRKPLRWLAGRYVAILSITAAVSIIAYGIKVSRDVWVKASYVTDAETKYEQAENRLKASNQLSDDLDRLVYAAHQLRFLRPDHPLSEARLSKALIVRDIFRRPSLLKTNVGAHDLLTRLGNTQRSFLEAGKSLDGDLNILYGLLLWQRGADRFSEYIAASILAGEIERERKDNKSFLIMLPLAYCYLFAYLSYPLADDVIKELYEKSGNGGTAVFDEVDSKEASPLKRRYRIEELRRVLSLTEFDQKRAKENQLYAFVKTTVEAVRTHRIIVSHYSELLRLTWTLNETKEPERGPIRQSIRNVGNSIINIWNNYMEGLEKGESASETARLNQFGKLWPIYNRALGAVALKDNEVSITAASEDKGIHHRWLSSIVRPIVSEASAKVMSTAVRVDYVYADSRLKLLENSIPDIFAKHKEYGAKIAKLEEECKDVIGGEVRGGIFRGGGVFHKICYSIEAEKVADELRVKLEELYRSSIELGLIGCRHQDEAHFICRQDDASIVPLGVLVANAVGKSVEIEKKFSDETIRRRVVPAL